jgi:hypothetical protein
MPQTVGTVAAPVGTTFLSAGFGDAVIEQAAAAHSGQMWADERAGPIAAFPTAADALAAALDVRRIWRRCATGDEEPQLAVHMDDGYCEKVGGGYAGPGVSRCRRLREIGWPGQTLVSAAVVGAAGAPPGAALRDLGLHRLADLSPPLRVFELSDGDDGAAAPLRSLDAYSNNLASRRTPFIGREAELAELHLRLAGTRVLTIVGPGGSGTPSARARRSSRSTSEFQPPCT